MIIWKCRSILLNLVDSSKLPSILTPDISVKWSLVPVCRNRKGHSLLSPSVLNSMPLFCDRYQMEKKIFASLSLPYLIWFCSYVVSPGGSSSSGLIQLNAPLHLFFALSGLSLLESLFWAGVHPRYEVFYKHVLPSADILALNLISMDLM